MAALRKPEHGQFVHDLALSEDMTVVTGDGCESRGFNCRFLYQDGCGDHHCAGVIWLDKANFRRWTVARLTGKGSS